MNFFKKILGTQDKTSENLSNHQLKSKKSSRYNWGKLKEQGILTEEEFQKEKERILKMWENKY